MSARSARHCRLLRATGGVIVNVSSTAGKWPSSGTPHYSVTKAAVLSLSRLVVDLCLEPPHPLQRRHAWRDRDGRMARHADGGEHRHVQTFAVRRATGADALKGAAGELIISGNTGRVVKADQGCLAYAGLAPDLFASDGAGFGAFRKALWSENRFAPEAFQNRQNFFGGKNVTAIVLEVPSSLIGRGVVHAWATASLYGHAPEVQVSRWGLPMITHLLLSDPSLHDASENYNRAVPADEVALFSKPIRDFVEKVTALAHSAADPSAYATQLLARLCPSVLPYELDTPASFSFAAFNGRGLCDDVMDVILTLATNTALGDGVAPDMRLMRPDFPYFGEPHVTAASSAKQ